MIKNSIPNMSGFGCEKMLFLKPLSTLWFVAVFCIFVILLWYQKNSNTAITILNKYQINPINNIKSFNDLSDIWIEIFECMFVKKKLHYDNISFPCKDIFSIREYLNITKKILYANVDLTSINYHEMVQLRRLIMITAYSNNINHNEYKDLLSIIHSILQNINDKTNRDMYPFFNIHISRSAGTSICKTFEFYSESNSNIRTQPNRKRNCNLDYIFGQPNKAIHYAIQNNISLIDTCEEQYIKARNMYNITFIARENPMHHNGKYVINKNKNKVIKPDLCNKFIYMMPIRSPLERILSWSPYMLKTYSYNNDIINSWLKDDYIRNVFEYVYSDTNIDSMKLSYINNVIVRWLGFEMDYKYEMMYHKSFVSMINNKEITDMDFKNSIQLLLKIDYVLPFAMFEEDFSIKIASKLMNISFMDYVPKISKMHVYELNIWDILLKHLNKHYKQDNLDTSFSEWKSKSQHSGPKKHKISSTHIAKIISKKSWELLVKNNKLDIILYTLAKYIDVVDTQYYTEFIPEAKQFVSGTVF